METETLKLSAEIDQKWAAAVDLYIKILREGSALEELANIIASPTPAFILKQYREPKIAQVIQGLASIALQEMSVRAMSRIRENAEGA